MFRRGGSFGFRPRFQSRTLDFIGGGRSQTRETPQQRGNTLHKRPVPHPPPPKKKHAGLLPDVHAELDSQCGGPFRPFSSNCAINFRSRQGDLEVLERLHKEGGRKGRGVQKGSKAGEDYCWPGSTIKEKAKFEGKPSDANKRILSCIMDHARQRGVGTGRRPGFSPRKCEKGRAELAFG